MGRNALIRRAAASRVLPRASRSFGFASGSAHEQKGRSGSGALDSLYRNTPLIKPFTFQQARGDVEFLLKLDSLQPSGSYKDRGLSRLISHYHSRGTELLISSSGGNAGFSAATAAKKLGIPIEVYVPTTTKRFMVERIRGTGARVIVDGNNWNEADARAQQRLREAKNASYVPPFDHPLIWEGNSTVVDELVEAGVKPDTIVLSVGGGGLLAGVQQGLIRHGWHDVKVLAVETEGACSYAAARAAGRVVRIDKISSIATSLGALSVVPITLDQAEQIQTVSQLVSDVECVRAIRKFLDDVRILVEPAAGASLSIAYEQRHAPMFRPGERVVIIVCGGSVVTIEQLQTWEQEFGIPNIAY